MALRFSEVRWVIVMALWRIAPSASAGKGKDKAVAKWSELADARMADTFQQFANPDGWDSFFAEAFGTALQQEVMARGSYVPDLVETVVTFADADSTETWAELEAHVQAKARVLSVA